MAYNRCKIVIESPKGRSHQLEGELKDCHTWCSGPMPQICHSGAGYYIGTMDGEGPLCRMTEYFSSRATAEHALAQLAPKLEACKS
jgi:hypothetical protein